MADAPLFGTPIQSSGPSLSDLDLKRKLAQALMGGTGDTSPVGSPWAALNRALSPLVGVLINRSADRGRAAMEAEAAPLYSELAHSTDPTALAAAMKNPLIRAMLPQLTQAQINQGFETRTDATKAEAAKKLALQYDPQIAGATADAKGASDLHYQPQIAGVSAMAQVPAAVAQERETLPYKLQLLKIQQALGYANLGEETRHNKSVEASTAAAAASGGGGFSNPAVLYGPPQ